MAGLLAVPFCTVTLLRLKVEEHVIATHKHIGPFLFYPPWELVSEKRRICVDSWPKRTRLVRFHQKNSFRVGGASDLAEPHSQGPGDALALFL